jgi:hypothetical protein
MQIGETPLTGLNPQDVQQLLGQFVLFANHTCLFVFFSVEYVVNDHNVSQFMCVVQIYDDEEQICLHTRTHTHTHTHICDVERANMPMKGSEPEAMRLCQLLKAMRLCKLLEAMRLCQHAVRDTHMKICLCSPDGPCGACVTVSAQRPDDSKYQVNLVRSVDQQTQGACACACLVYVPGQTCRVVVACRNKADFVIGMLQQAGQ